MDEKTINKIAWWIPIRKWRDNFRKNYYHHQYYNKEFLRLLGIEIFSYCNRKCWFCPNSSIDRHSVNNYMDENIYLKILNEVKNYKNLGYITYSIYNEPLSDTIFLKRLKQAREILPNIKLQTNTNGDFLDKEYLEELHINGLNELWIQCYLNKDEEFDIENIIKPRMHKLIKKLNLDYEIVISNQDIYELSLKHNNLTIRYYARNFKNTGTNRGGTVNTIPIHNRLEPCFIPYVDIIIDYMGNVMPCCNLRSEVEEHEQFIMGNVANDTISNIRKSKKFQNFMKTVSQYGNKIYPCNECNFALDYKPDIK